MDFLAKIFKSGKVKEKKSKKNLDCLRELEGCVGESVKENELNISCINESAISCNKYSTQVISLSKTKESGRLKKSLAMSSCIFSLSSNTKTKSSYDGE